MSRKKVLPKSDILLCTPEDIRRVRDKLVIAQGGIDPITQSQIVTGCLDHAHDETQQVRGVLSREINVLVGKIENCYTRNIKYWCSKDLPFLLRNIADYLEQKPLDIIHVGWKKRCYTAFNKLNSKGKDRTLGEFGRLIVKPNDAKRKLEFKKLLSSRLITYGEFMEVINESK